MSNPKSIVPKCQFSTSPHKIYLWLDGLATECHSRAVARILEMLMSGAQSPPQANAKIKVNLNMHELTFCSTNRGRVSTLRLHESTW